MWQIPLTRRLRLNGSLFALAVSIGLFACGGASDPGQVRFVVHATPPPDDALLSPLTDLRVTALDLRDGSSDAILAHTRFDPTPAGMTPAGSVDLSSVSVSPDPRDLRMLALGSAGQQVLGLALYRGASWAYGKSDQEIKLEIRRPLFFFGGSPKLIPPMVPLDSNNKEVPEFEPNQQIYAPLKDATRLRVIDPNSVNPLLSVYDKQLDSSTVTAAAGTFDGQSLLVATLVGKLHIVDTLKLEDQGSTDINDSLPAQSIVVDPLDKTAAVLLYQKPPAASGRVGRIVFLRELGALRSRASDGSPMSVDIDASAVNPPGVPLSAAYTPDGSKLDVIIAAPPVQLGQPDCAMLGAGNKALLRRYDPTSGALMEETPLPYTTAVAYTAAGDQVLVQPCTKPVGAVRPGQVLIHKQDGTGDHVLSAPGTSDLAVVGNALIAIGSKDVADGLMTVMRATVRILEPNASDWSTSEFDLPAWQVPYRVSGQPHSVDMLFYPSDVMSYGISVTPDRARALVLMRVLHKTYTGSAGLYLDSTPNESCYVQWSGYTYHVLLVNLQNGAREQDYLVGVQNQSCTSRWYCDKAPCPDVGLACFSPCDPGDSNHYLSGFQDGYLPSAASVLFGRR